MNEEEKRRGRGRSWRSQDQANKVWNLDFCMELTLDMNSSMDHMDFVWLITCLSRVLLEFILTLDFLKLGLVKPHMVQDNHIILSFRMDSWLIESL